MKNIILIAVLCVSLIIPVSSFAFDGYGNNGNAEAQAGANANINQFNEASDLNEGRQFANPATPQFGPVINYFGQPLPSEGFQPVEQIIMYSEWFTEGALESMLKGVEKVDAEFKTSNLRVANAKPAAEDGTTRWIKIVVSRDKYKCDGPLGFKGFITAKSLHRDTTMVETVAKAALVAVQNGCNVIHFSAQGAVRDVFSSGWGIGFNTTQAQVYSGDLTKSNVSSGGMGYSSAKAGTRDLPWLQGFGLVDANLEYPVLDIPAEVTAEAVTIKAPVASTDGHQIAEDIKPQTGNHTKYGSLQAAE